MATIGSEAVSLSSHSQEKTVQETILATAVSKVKYYNYSMGVVLAITAS